MRRQHMHQCAARFARVEAPGTLVPWSVRAPCAIPILAYFLKLPGNFGQRNLANGCPYAQREARCPTRTYIKDFPSGFFREKISKSRDRTFCLGISTFFAASRREATPRSAREFLAFWPAFALFSTKLSAVFSGGTAGSSCPQCTHTRTHIHTRAARRSAVAATVAAGVNVRQ